jgi:hypothetical protein
MKPVFGNGWAARGCPARPRRCRSSPWPAPPREGGCSACAPGPRSGRCPRHVSLSSTTTRRRPRESWKAIAEPTTPAPIATCRPSVLTRSSAGPSISAGPRCARARP